MASYAYCNPRNASEGRYNFILYSNQSTSYMLSNEILDFSVKSKSILPLMVTSNDTLFYFHCFKNGFSKKSRIMCLPENGLIVGYLSENTPRTLTCSDRTADAARDVRPTTTESRH